MEKKKNRWLVLIAAIVVNISLGAGYAWSVFQEALLEINQDWSLSETSLAFSISFAMVPVAMIISGPIVDKYGGRLVVLISGILFGLGMFATGFVTSIPALYLTYGLILGLGIGAGYGTATALTVKWFPDKKGLAGGLTAAGFGGGAIILAPIATAMIDSMGISSTFRTLGVVLLVFIVGASFIMDNPPAAEKTEDTQSITAAVTSNDVTFKEMLKESNFWILWTVYIFAATSGMMIIGHAANIANTYSLGEGAFVVMIVGLANTLGRVFWGSVSDRIGRYKTVLAMFVVSAAGLILVNLSETIGAVLGITGLVFIALSFGGFLGSFPGITAENWGSTNSATNYGWMFTAYGIAAVVGPSIGSNIREASGSYSLALNIATVMAVLGFILTAWYLKRAKKVATEPAKV